MEVRELANTRCLFATNEPLGHLSDVLRLLGDAISEDATTVVVPADRLSKDFFDLRTGFAGEVLQKAANYRTYFAVVGDVSEYTAASRAFHDLVVESEQANGYCFVPDHEALERTIAALDMGGD